MKKTLLSLITVLAINSYNAQQSILVINNYTAYDFHTALSAIPSNSCYPSVEIGYVGNLTNPSQIIVPANSNNMNGQQLMYKNFWDSANPVSNGLYPITTYWVSTSATNSGPRTAINSTLNPSGPISQNTDWRHAKFYMTYPGTNTTVGTGSTPLTYFLGNLDDGNNTCTTGDTYISTTYGDAELFTITDTSGQKFTYISVF